MRVSVACVLLAALVAPWSASAEAPTEPAEPAEPAKVQDSRSKTATEPCPADGEPPSLLAIGGSTMKNTLGRMLDKVLSPDGWRVAKHGKAASGLARPDYYDWPAAAKGLVAGGGADIVVVALGSNDGQSLKHGDGRWTRLKYPDQWVEEYGRRVDAMLSLLAGKNRERAVIWFGPMAHGVEAKRKRGARTARVIRERVEAFDGRAWYLDLYGRTSTADGGARQLVAGAGGAEHVKIRMRDGFHLTKAGVRMLMVEPLLELLAPCRR